MTPRQRRTGRLLLYIHATGVLPYGITGAQQASICWLTEFDRDNELRDFRLTPLGYAYPGLAGRHLGIWTSLARHGWYVDIVHVRCADPRLRGLGRGIPIKHATHGHAEYSLNPKLAVYLWKDTNGKPVTGRVLNLKTWEIENGEDTRDLRRGPWGPRGAADIGPTPPGRLFS